MKKARTDDLRAEYSHRDLGPGVRGKHSARYRKGTNLVLLSPDVAEAFPTDDAVNQALRSLIDLAHRSTRPARRSRKQGSKVQAR